MDLNEYLAAPFHAFVLVCDQEQNVGPRAALRFQGILGGRPPCRSPLFRQMLVFCAESYPTLWRDYVGSRLEIDLRVFRDLWASLAADVPPADFAILEEDMSGMARALFRAGFLVRPRSAKRKAFADFMHVVRVRSLPPGFIEPPARRQGSRQEASAVLLGRVEPASSTARPPSPTVTPAPGETPAKGALTLVCAKITDEARNVRTFSFTSGENGGFRYDPGQFLTIQPVIDGRTVPRSYTISSTPTRPALLEITVKRIAGGLVSNWLHDNLVVGSEMKARGPFGKFTCLRHPGDKYLFLAAGSGITPLMSMLRYLHDVASPADVVFFQSAGSEQDLVFRNELALLEERNPRIHVALSLSSPPVESAWDGLCGRLDNEMLRRISPDFLERVTFACGPAGFMDKAKQLLAGNGFPLDARFHEESFVPRKPPGPERTKERRTGASRKIVFVRSGKVFESAGNETLLEAAEGCGVAIPSACRQGRCGTCRATKLSGEVSMPDQEALTPDEISLGEVLTCIAQPGSETIEMDL